MRAGRPVRAGTFAYDGHDLVTGWHTHDLHQVEYALLGFVEVETAAAHYLLPPQQAAWIPAGLPHQSTLKRVRSVSVFFEPAMVRRTRRPGPDPRRDPGDPGDDPLRRAVADQPADE